MMFPGSLFGDHCDDYVRISLLQPIAKVQEAISRMEKVVKALVAAKRASA